MQEKYPLFKREDFSKMPECLLRIYSFSRQIISRNRENNSEVFGGKFISHIRVSINDNGEIGELFLCGNNFAEGRSINYYGDMVAVHSLGENIFLVRKNEEEAQKMKEEEAIKYLEDLVL